jgi:hypothetical protein
MALELLVHREPLTCFEAKIDNQGRLKVPATYDLSALHFGKHLKADVAQNSDESENDTAIYLIAAPGGQVKITVKGRSHTIYLRDALSKFKLRFPDIVEVESILYKEVPILKICTHREDPKKKTAPAAPVVPSAPAVSIPKKRPYNNSVSGIAPKNKIVSKGTPKNNITAKKPAGRK